MNHQGANNDMGRDDYGRVCTIDVGYSTTDIVPMERRSNRHKYHHTILCMVGRGETRADHNSVADCGSPGIRIRR